MNGVVSTICAHVHARYGLMGMGNGDRNRYKEKKGECDGVVFIGRVCNRGAVRFVTF